MAGGLGLGRPARAGRQAVVAFASLREDYLNQVRRDFLSRGLSAATPLADALFSNANVILVHPPTPSRRWSFGLVVVYCSSVRCSGNRRAAAAKAARVASWKPHRMSFFLPG